MRLLLTIFIFLVAVVFSHSIIAQEMGSLRKGIQFSIPEKIQGPLGDPIPVGTYSIGTAGDFPTIDSAFNKLSIDGIAGEVTLELIDDLYTAPTDDFGFLLIGPIPGAGSNSRVTLKPAANTNVTIEGNGGTVLIIAFTSYMTIDGVSLTGSSSLTVRSIPNFQYPANDAILFIDDADNNIIQNTIVIVEDRSRFKNTAIGFFLSEFSKGVFDNNIIQNNHIKQSSAAIVISARHPNFKVGTAFNNIIRGNIVGSETDTLISWGIQIEKTQNTVIENNIVQNIHTYSPDLFFALGINSYWGTGTIIRNNVVHNVSSDRPGGSIGILLSGNPINLGNDNLIYNNMVYDIRSTSTKIDSRVSGIQMWYQNNPKIYYNSVYLSGNGANPQGSAALYMYGGFGNTINNVEVKNNIFVNTRDESPYSASAIYDYSDSNLTTDYNDLYYEPNQYNAIVRIDSTKYNNLSEWQATGNDINSVTEMPNFIVPDLHIDPTISTNIESGATPIAGIDTDFDGDLRNVSTPDIGADEFNGTVVSVVGELDLPSEYRLSQNYPNPFNPSTVIKYQIPELSFVTLKVYDVLGNEVATLANEEKPIGTYTVEFDATELSSGIYFYRIQAGSGRSFVETKKMMLLR